MKTLSEIIDARMPEVAIAVFSKNFKGLQSIIGSAATEFLSQSDMKKFSGLDSLSLKRLQGELTATQDAILTLIIHGFRIDNESKKH